MTGFEDLISGLLISALTIVGLVVAYKIGRATGLKEGFEAGFEKGRMHGLRSWLGKEKTSGLDVKF